MRCRDCDGHGAYYMVTNDVWLQAWPTYVEDKNRELDVCEVALGIPTDEKLTEEQHTLIGRSGDLPSGMLCLPCLEKRLGRPLDIEDFPEHLPVNFGIISGYRMAKKHANESCCPCGRTALPGPTDEG